MQAERGMQELLESVDTMIVIPNEKLLAVAQGRGVLRELPHCRRCAAAGRAGDLGHHHDSGRDQPRLCGREDDDGGDGLRGDGHGGAGGQPSRDGSSAAAMASPLLEAGAIDGARGILINITGSSSLKLIGSERGIFADSDLRRTRTRTSSLARCWTRRWATR